MRLNRDGFSIDAAIEKGRSLPEWYVNEPAIEASDVFYMKAFYDLNTCRSIGMGLGQIPWNVTVEYADRYGLEWDLSEAFVDIIREMDEGFLEWKSSEQEKARIANAPSKKRNKHG